ncbi:MAG TPA: DUF1775 domain-containing protein [Polyangiaceae bacterium]|jgi:uncharacterized protein YcnI|nr:DUF1775 domain-containing protein [Polyangiaceae bacterium]
MKFPLSALLVTAPGILTTSLASAHITVAGPAFANATFEASFSVGHGCENPNAAGTMLDTYSVTVDIPAGVTSVRAVDSTLGKAVIDSSGGNVTSITWTKTMSDVLTADVDFYRLPVRMKMPDAAFTTVYFNAHQLCLGENDTQIKVDWVGTTAQTTALPDGAPPPEPAPNVVLLPARVPGWNKYTVAQKLTSLAVFNDAEIVWAGDAAYSVNPNYTALIATEPNTTLLKEIAAGTDIWVKY